MFTYLLQGSKTKLGAAVVALIVLLGVVGLVLLDSSQEKAYAVKQGKRVLFVTKDKAAVESAVRKYQEKEAKRIGHAVKLAAPVTYHRVKPKKGEAIDKKQVAGLVAEKVDLRTKAAGIVVNGQPVVYLADEEKGKKVLNELKQRYSGCEEGEKIVSLNFEEEVKILPCEVSSRLVVDPEDAAEIVLAGKGKRLRYVVKEGDSLWLIARRYDTHVSDIVAFNNLKTEKLQPGQELLITDSRPLLNVVARIEGTKTEKIPFPTKVVIDRKLGSGVRVKQQGKDGEKKVAYQLVKKNGMVVEKKTISEAVVKQPVPRVVARGPRGTYIVASRSGGNFVSGFVWPLVGGITSYFGGKRGHTGVDIDGKTGDPIRAVEDGVVVFAGREGGYGLMVVVDHANGIKTRYAHCSKLLVKDGQKVEKGQVIALVGATGRSTGSHLHFEVIRDGSYENPLRYLR